MAPPKDVTETIVEYKNAAEDWDIEYESPSPPRNPASKEVIEKNYPGYIIL